MFYLIALAAMLTSLFALLTGFPILGLYQNKRIKKLVETNQLVPEIKNNLDKKLKRKEKGESVIYTPKKWNSNYMIHFIKESSHWKIEIETAMEYRTVVITVVDGQIFNVRTNSKMREKENQIKRQVELLEKTILEIIEKLDSLEMGRNNEQHGSTEMENLYALKEALIMIEDLTFKENEIHSYHVGRYSSQRLSIEIEGLPLTLRCKRVSSPTLRSHKANTVAT